MEKTRNGTLFPRDNMVFTVDSQGIPIKVAEYESEQVQDDGYFMPEPIDIDEVISELRKLSKNAYDWRLDDKICGIPYRDFEKLMENAADLIEYKE